MNSVIYFNLGIATGCITLIVIDLIKIAIENKYLKGYAKAIEDADARETSLEEVHKRQIISAYQQGTYDRFDAPHFGSGLNYYRETYKK